MSLKTQILDGAGSGKCAHLFQRNGDIGQIVYQERLKQFLPEVHPFVNDAFGTAMNQAITFGGTPELIHDGGDAAGWTGAATQGTWDFADTTNPNDGLACVSLTSANNNDQATFADGTETDMSGRTAITGQLRLDAYNESNSSIILQFQNNNVNVGNSINLNDYINTGSLGAYQGFVIPKADFGISADTVDEIDMTMTRAGGAKPTFRFDQFQIEQTGTPAVFKSITPVGTRFHITEIRISIADALTGITAVAGATENATVPNLAYDQILGVSSLTNGILFQRVQNSKVLFSVSLRQLSDFLGSGSNIINHISNGTNTYITILITFPEPIVIEGFGGEEHNFLSYTISDDLSGLLQLSANARGAIEV